MLTFMSRIGLDVNKPASFPIDMEGVATQQVTPMHLLVQGNFTSGAQMLLDEPTILVIQRMGRYESYHCVYLHACIYIMYIYLSLHMF